MPNPNAKYATGTRHLSTNNGGYIVTDYINCNKVVIQFIATGAVVTTKTCRIAKGDIKDPLKRAVYGKGYIGIGEYAPRNNMSAYHRWRGILRACYMTKGSSLKLTKNWHNFQDFCKWYTDSCCSVGIDSNDNNAFITKEPKSKTYNEKSCSISHKNRRGEKLWELISPTGEKFEICNLKQFCIDKELKYSSIYAVASGVQSSYCGWIKG
nr:hypothetical protein [Vibrio splendidus]MCC4880738.1 hypothetical protein [Vibrio splendidus]